MAAVISSGSSPSSMERAMVTMPFATAITVRTPGLWRAMTSDPVAGSSSSMGSAERRFVVGYDFGGREGYDHFLADLGKVRQGGFIDIEGDTFAQAEVDE